MNGIVLDWTRIVEHAKDLPAERRATLLANAEKALSLLLSVRAGQLPIGVRRRSRLQRDCGPGDARVYFVNGGRALAFPLVFVLLRMSAASARHR